MGAMRAVAAYVAASLFVLGPIGTVDVTVRRRPVKSKNVTTRAADKARPSLDDLLAPYRGLAAWIDIYNRQPWSRPDAAAARLHRRGARTLFLQTGNYSTGRALYHYRDLGRFLRAAHRRDMRVVAWYVPSFARPRRDFRRARAAILFKAGAHRFDGFALDIEATKVAAIPLRNRRLLELSARLRKLVGRSYALGAIIPDAGSTYWPRFPYRRMARRYDVMLPMAYYTFRTSGHRRVKNYISRNVRLIRSRTATRRTPIHMIGGIAGQGGSPALRGFVRAVKRHRLLGGSLYDAPITTRREWKELRRINRPDAE